MSTESPPIFTEESFLSKLVPFFEERKAQLSTLLANDAQWMAFFSKLHLVYIDNHKSARDSWLYISNIVDDNRYFADTEPARPEEVLFGGSSERFPEAQAVYITVLQQLCFAFLEELLSRATPEQIASFIQQYLQSIYRTVEKRVKPDYIWFQVPNIKFRSVGLFAL
ncbi:MAG TPA: hypothetical protein VFV38_39285, partial [Ktedonobacteraceae bacterium]|nr:hypothetical protein [Ktedonobacteraceae bacterium]